MDEHDVLTRANDLLGEYGIARGSHAVNAAGVALPTGHPEVVGFCSVGAIARACLDLGVPTWHEKGLFHSTVEVFRATIGEESVTEWNDNMASDEEIRAAFKHAARLAVVTSDDLELAVA